MNWRIYGWDEKILKYKIIDVIPTPGATFSVTKRAPYEIHDLIDGSKRITFLPVDHVYEILSWSISMVSVTPQLISALETFIKIRQKVILETHTGECFEGYFINLVKVYEMTGIRQLWSLEIEFFIEKSFYKKDNPGLFVE